MADIATINHTSAQWDRLLARVRAEIAVRQVHCARSVVLVPYAQLMHEASGAWLRTTGAVSTDFLPSFESTQNWATRLGGFEPTGDDLRLDAARDALTASSLLKRAGLGARQAVMSARLMEAAWSLAKVAAAVPPDQRSQWGEQMGNALTSGTQASVGALEAAVDRIALAWVASSSYASDRVFSAEPDLLVLLEGFQGEAMLGALQHRLGSRLLVLPLTGAGDGPIDDVGSVALHASADAEDEAQRASACVLAHLAAGRSPVALVAQDRLLTRRVSAMLVHSGVALRDETGWKLSTTRAAAALMSLLRACVWNVGTDAVLDWLKNASAFDSSDVSVLETSLRRSGQRNWSGVPTEDGLVVRVNTLRESLQPGRGLSRWLADVRAALQTAGQWSALLSDAAGQAVLEALRLGQGAETEFADVPVRLSQSEFCAWVAQTLESGSFRPEHPASAQVVILPLSQLLGRTLAAVVLPGCDEKRLPVSPEPPGAWTGAQRTLLGLPSREQLSEAARAAWRYALKFPHVDVLWRTSEGGERLMSSGFVRELQLLRVPDLASDPCVLRALLAQPCGMPDPRGDALAVKRLSGSAYGDLRACPYRFFALRQLGLRESDELELELDKRDFGNWLHQLLKFFHEALKAAPTCELFAREAMINVAAQQATEKLGLSESEFLPFAATWPRVRSGYLSWLSDHEASGATFLEAEAWKEAPLGHLTLIGKIDRVDRLSDGRALVLDYKTEARTATAQRIKAGLEDTQLAFYAALLSGDTLAGAYVNVGEKDGTKSYEQTDIVEVRDQLIEGIASDMARIAAGAPMPALGEGKACEFCAARGLCRKDFWRRCE